MRRKQMIFLICVALVFSVSACGENSKQQIALESVDTVAQEEDDAESADTQTEDEEDADSQNQIFVYVCGAVEKPGVYAMPEESRIYEAILQAGGFTQQAAVTQINQAELLEDEAYIYVPTADEAALGVTAGMQTSQDTKVDLNRAGREELMTIPGIGEAKADQIIRYRTEQGRFQRIEDIMNISGIKEGLFEKIQDYIKV